MERNKLEDPAVELAALKASLLEKTNSVNWALRRPGEPVSWEWPTTGSVIKDNAELAQYVSEVATENLHLRSVIEMFLSDNYTDFFEHFEECCKQAKNAIGKP